MGSKKKGLSKQEQLDVLREIAHYHNKVLKYLLDHVTELERLLNVAPPGVDSLSDVGSSIGRVADLESGE